MEYKEYNSVIFTNRTFDESDEMEKIEKVEEVEQVSCFRYFFCCCFSC